MLKIENKNNQISLTKNGVVIVPNITNERVALYTLSYYKNKYNGIGKIALDKTLSENEIIVRSDDTTYVNLVLKPMITPKQVIDKLRHVRKIAKQYNVKTKGYNKAFKYIKENIDQFEEDQQKQRDMFIQLKDSWLDYELYMGMSCDYFYNETLCKLRSDINKLNQTNSTLSKIHKIVDNLEDIEDNIENLISFTY